MVSIIIPCFRQTHFLSSAIESVLAQTYGNFEIIVVDDGSPDDPTSTANRYPTVRCIRQKNLGRSAARNAGVRVSSGELLVLLDADDRLLPGALETGIRYMEAHPDCAFVWGGAYDIDSLGRQLTTPLISRPHEQCTGGSHYVAFLHGNYVLINTVVFRKSAFEAVGGFNVALHAAEDLDLYLRMSRRFPVLCHAEVVAERRRHSTNTVNRPARTVPFALAVLRSQWPYVRGCEEYEIAYWQGIRHFVSLYGFGPVYAVWLHARERDWRESAVALKLIMVQPRYLWYFGRRLFDILCSQQPRRRARKT